MNSFEDEAFMTKLRDANVPVQEEGTDREVLKQDKAQRNLGSSQPHAPSCESLASSQIYVHLRKSR